MGLGASRDHPGPDDQDASNDRERVGCLAEEGEPDKDGPDDCCIAKRC